MSSPYIGEIMIFGGNFAPRGYSFCNGQLLPIAQNSALFAIIGTTYGGNGVVTMGLPNLQSRLPMHQGQGPGLSSRTLAEQAGTASVTLLSTQMPAHTHAAGSLVAAAPTTANPVGAYPAQAASGTPYAATGGAIMGGVTSSAPTLATAGGNQPHDNLMPFLCVNFCIALEGIFPSPN